MKFYLIFASVLVALAVFALQPSAVECDSNFLAALNRSKRQAESGPATVAPSAATDAAVSEQKPDASKANADEGKPVKANGTKKSSNTNKTQKAKTKKANKAKKAKSANKANKANNSKKSKKAKSA